MRRPKNNSTGYDEKDDAVIINHIQNSPQNLTHAFEEAARELGRTFGAVQQRYYSFIKKNTKVLALATKKGYVLGNTKQVARKSTKELSETDAIELMEGMYQSLSARGKKVALRSFLNI